VGQTFWGPVRCLCGWRCCGGCESRGLLHRLTRYLDAAASLAADGVVGYQTDPAETPRLPQAFRRDAELLRTLTNGAQ
jgi:hypothetical protein